jgi:hypothetical protein
LKAVKSLKLIDKFLKFLKTDRNTFFTYILTLLSIYFFVDRLVELVLLVLNGVCVDYWGPFMYTFALACPIFAFLFSGGSKFAKSNKAKETLFYLYVICLYMISISMISQWFNMAIWLGLSSLPGYTTLALEFPELFRPALSAIALYLPLISVPMLFKFLYMGVNDSQLWKESIWDYGGIKLAKPNTEGTGSYACEMFVCTDKETGRKCTIPETSRFNQFLVVGPSGTGKTSLVFEPCIARDFEKKYFFTQVSKEMGVTALRTGIATLNKPYSNDYLNEHFTLNMLTPVQSKQGLYDTYMKKMIIGKSGDTYIYRNLGLTSISPDYESIGHMIDVANNYNLSYNIIDPNNSNSIGLNPFVYDSPLKAASVFTQILKASYQGTSENVDKSTMENFAFQAVENICILLKTTYPIVYKDKDYLPTLEDIVKLFSNFDLVENLCNTLESVPEVAEQYRTQLSYFKKNFYKNSPGRENTEKVVLYASSVFEKLLKNSGLKQIICNRHNNINYDNVLANGEITFVCTRRGDLGPSVHKLFGIFFMILMQNSVLRRPGNESTRVPHFLYIDEFPEYMSKITEPIFTLYRKYKVGTTLSTQTLAQLGSISDKYKQTITSNCMNKIVFGGGDSTENEWWSKEFGNVRYWKFGNSYDTAKGKYDDKLSGIEWAWKSKFAPDKVRSLSFKSCLFKWKNNNGSIDLCDGKIDFMEAKHKEKHTNKKYDFEKYTNGISEEPDEKKKKTTNNWKTETVFNEDSNGDVDPIKSDENILYDNEDAIIFDLKKGNPNG